MRFSHLCAVLSLHAIGLVAAQDDQAPAPKVCGCKNRHHAAAAMPAGANPSTLATVVVSSHRCMGTHHMQAPAVASPDAPAAVAPTVVQAPVADASPAAPSDSPAAQSTPDASVPSVAADSAPSAAATPDSAPSAAAASVDAPASVAAPAAASTQAAAQDTPSASPSTVPVVSNAAASGLTADQLIAIMPSSSSCTSATPAGECLSAAQAAPLLTQSFTKYGLSNKGVQAAAIALIALESGEMKYIQHYNGGSPARTGQGTYNEMSPSFVVEYAKSLYGASAPSDAVSAMDKINSSPGDSIASAAWFIQAHCGASLISQFASDPESAWNSYITACIFTPMTDARRAYWNKAKTALGV